MSGFEIVGLVLAIVPIFEAASGITSRAVEHTRVAFSPMRAASKLEDFYTNLHYELSMLQLAIQKLVDELVGLNDEEKSSMRQGSPLWTDPRVVRAVEDRLGVGNNTFLLHLAKLLQQLEKLVKKDKSVRLLSNQGKPVNDSVDEVFSKLYQLRTEQQHGKPIEELIARILFTFAEEKRTAILSKISRYNKKLAKLLDFSTSTTSDNVQSAKKSPHIHLIRPMMHSLYQTMGKLWPCDCEQAHKARICLLHCPDQDPTSKVYFNMLMSIQEDASPEYCSWLESKICVSLDSDSPTSTSKISKVKFVIDMSAQESTRPTPQPTPPHSPDELDRSLSGLTLHDTQSISFTNPFDPSAPTRPSSPPSPRTPPNPRNPRVRVQSFCDELPKSAHHKICPQMHFDGDALWKMQPTKNKLYIEVSRPSKSLAELLREDRRFNLRERRILAVILAHSLLHFCESPWLSRHWDKKHLEFFHRISKNGQLDLQRPWLATDFEPFKPAEDADRFNRIHPNPSVLALGILLLEIELYATIESQRSKDDCKANGEVDCNTDFFTADRMLKNNVDELYDGYKKSVEACLTCDFVEAGQSRSLDDKEFRHAAYEHIVVPLEDELFHAYGLKPEDLGLEQS